mgnify:CR=1 FL=1
MNDLIFCTGFKGGIGKSFMTAAVVDYLSSKNDNIVVVDTDSTIPDIFKTFKETYKTYACDLDLDEGWSSLFSICEEHKDSQVVVNSAAGADKTFIQNIKHIELASEILERRLISFFMLNDEKDSLNQLDKYYEATYGIAKPRMEVLITGIYEPTYGIANHRMAVVKNGYFGADAVFDVYNTSNLKAKIEQGGCVSYYLAALAPHVRQKIKLERKSFADAANILSFGDRIFLDAWRNKVHAFLGGFFDA